MQRSVQQDNSPRARKAAAIRIRTPIIGRHTRRRTLAAVQRRTAQLQPFTLTEFSEILSDASGTPARIAASTDLPPGVAGWWLRTDTGNLIEYDAGLPEIARINTVLHEAGHILHGHNTIAQRLDTGRAPCSIISPTAIAHFAQVRYRSAYDSKSEREAETFARRTMRTILWSDADSGESTELLAALGFPRTRIE